MFDRLITLQNIAWQAMLENLEKRQKHFMYAYSKQKMFDKECFVMWAKIYWIRMKGFVEGEEAKPPSRQATRKTQSRNTI